MAQVNEVQKTKKRARRSPSMIAELILEAERKGNAAEICRRESIAPWTAGGELDGICA